jgi:SAM-dependent methyltransferase
MRANIKRWVAAVAERLDLPEPIYEFGSFRVPGQEELADMRPLFPGKKFVGCDMREGLGVDVVLDLHDVDYRLQPESVGTVLCLETMEHVRYPQEAMSQIHYVLKEGGVALITSTMAQAIHNYPSDYWRFTPEGFKVLLEAFTSSFVDACGEEKRPLCVVGVGVKEESVNLSCLRGALQP